MKKIIVLIISIIPIQLNSQWININPYQGLHCTSVHFIDSLNGWICGNNGVIIHTKDGGLNWALQESGINSNLRKIRFADLQNGWAIGDSGKILNTTNGGETWKLQNIIPNLVLNNLSVVSNQIVWVVGRWGSPSQYVLLATTNAGKSWLTKSFNLLPSEYVNDIFFVSDKKGWYCTVQYIAPFSGGGIYFTSDGGESWQLQKGCPDPLYSINFINENTGWCAGSWTIFKTTNGGSSWVKTEYNQHWFSHIYFIDDNIGWVIEYISSGAIKFTSNGGSTWIQQANVSSVNDIIFTEKRIGWIITDNGGVFYTNNGGGVFPSPPKIKYPINNQVISSDTVNLVWTSEVDILNYELNISEDSTFQNYLDTLITDTSFTLINLEPNKNYYWRVRALNNIGWGSFSSIGRYNTFVTDVKYYSDNLVDFFLTQNYPNPFNPVTTIQYALSSREFVTLKVYNVLGREIITLVNEEKQPGIYEIEFNQASDIRNLASGIYYYQLKAGSFVETKKMIYLK